MRFDPSIKEPLAEAYPALGRRAMYFPDDTALRFYIWLIAPDSPISIEKDWDLRVQLALERAGIDKSSPIYQDYESGQEGAMDAIFELFRVYADVRYESWFSAKQSLHIMNARLRDNYGLKDGDRLRVMSQIDSLIEKVVQMEYSLFKESHIKDIIAERASAQSLTGYAEMYAQNYE